MQQLKGRVIKAGQASGRALCTTAPISFFGGVDADSGEIVEIGHPLEGQCVAGRVLVFPHGKGSTVGSYILLRLARQGAAPAAIVNQSCETIIAVGAIISDIPCIDQIDISAVPDGARLQIDGGILIIEDTRE